MAKKKPKAVRRPKRSFVRHLQTLVREKRSEDHKEAVNYFNDQAELMRGRLESLAEEGETSCLWHQVWGGSAWGYGDWYVDTDVLVMLVDAFMVDHGITVTNVGEYSWSLND